MIYIPRRNVVCLHSGVLATVKVGSFAENGFTVVSQGRRGVEELAFCLSRGRGCFFFAKRGEGSMACFIFGAGSFCGLQARPDADDFIIAADGGWDHCCSEGIRPHLLLGDFDSLSAVPEFDSIRRVPVEKDDTDMMLAVKEGLQQGQRVFHLYGGMGGRRSDHTIANLQTLLYLARHGAEGWLYGQNEVYTAICDGAITLPARDRGIVSVFCLGADAEGVTIRGAQYEVEDIVLRADFPLGVSNHFTGAPVTVAVRRGSLLIGLLEQ